MIRVRHLAGILAASGLALAAIPGVCQETIGVAAVVRNQVTRGSGSARLNPNDSVVRRETVSTGIDGSARLVFLDQTNLSIGPGARIVLDEVVYPGPNARGNVVLDLTEGAFRFVSGRLAKEAYEIRTATSVIGIRGTQFDVVSTRDLTQVTLAEGEVVACARGARRSCVVLRNPGDTAVVAFRSARMGAPSSRVSFAGFCGADPALCSVTTLASLSSQCSEGRALDGSCVNPQLAFRMRQQACVLSQPRLSFIAPPCVLPSGTGVIPIDGGVIVDRNYRSPNNTVNRQDRDLDFLFERASPFSRRTTFR